MTLTPTESAIVIVAMIVGMTITFRWGYEKGRDLKAPVLDPVVEDYGFCDRCFKAFVKDEKTMDCSINRKVGDLAVNAPNAALCETCAKEVVWA